jgi:spore coat protein U-like protein
MQRMLKLAALAAVVATAAAMPAQADQVNGSFTVTANVSVSCSLNANPLGFGNFDPGLGVDGTASTTLDVTCTNGVPYSIAVDQGNYALTGDCTNPQRNMVNDTFAVYADYGLYSDAGYSVAVGCDASNDLEGTGTGSLQSLSLYGKLPVAQSWQPGTYSDTVNVTLTF